jgi:hypothetical protein
MVDEERKKRVLRETGEKRAGRGESTAEPLFSVCVSACVREKGPAPLTIGQNALTVPSIVLRGLSSHYCSLKSR